MGHFPEKPIMPGVLIIEAMAQASAILVTETLGKEGAKNKLVYFMSIDEAKFRKIVTPGDQILMEINLLKNRSNVWKFSATSKVSDKIVAEAIFSAMMVDSHE
jgi:3-hydroxyacyl-[acyl-carrier-protein] dehydratase